MRTSISLMMALATCAMCAGSARAEDGDVVTVEEEATVTMALTMLDVNDQNLQLGWKIRNDTDHDVWICDSMHPAEGQVYEHFLDTDGKTLVLRRRFDLPMIDRLTMKFPPLQSRYIRLGSGQEKEESLLLAMPVGPFRYSAGESGSAEYAKRLAMEIGFYDEDLPGLILQIVEIAEMLSCDLDVGDGDFSEIAGRFFGGWNIAKVFKYTLGFSGSVMSDDGKVTIPYMGRTLNGERILRIEVDGVRIPCRDWNPN